jgi:hypothetical protein
VLEKLIVAMLVKKFPISYLSFQFKSSRMVKVCSGISFGHLPFRISVGLPGFLIEIPVVSP